MVLSSDLWKDPKPNLRGAKKGQISRYFQSLTRPIHTWILVPQAVGCINITIKLICRFQRVESGERAGE